MLGCQWYGGVMMVKHVPKSSRWWMQAIWDLYFTTYYACHSQQHSLTTTTARWQHGCLWQEPCMDVSMMELFKRRTLEGKNREEGNGKPPRLFSLDMIPIDGCFEDVLQLWPLFFDVNCSAACRRSSAAASRMSCSSGRCSSSSTAACQVMGVIDLLLEQQNTRRRRLRCGGIWKQFVEECNSVTVTVTSLLQISCWV